MSHFISGAVALLGPRMGLVEVGRPCQNWEDGKEYDSWWILGSLMVPFHIGFGVLVVIIMIHLAKFISLL